MDWWSSGVMVRDPLLQYSVTPTLQFVFARCVRDFFKRRGSRDLLTLAKKEGACYAGSTAKALDKF
jgi:hypothetical protein